ncbi:hypothetical protein BOTBODRAFT_189468 [Botryobasidium botryosum FD-172 SS1]|uniref:Zn(2)-C6 fungal-type domain-containing protein n=1 Tax=Botryobasidium botryosum (strain FD-172 SS1) TaxID=930990 RepID=A0A067MB94_BOTB1|nr:hypothetical protein BOTBODRAFT_189468 [Botryobasidium botryosum FD-172 SS1]
MSSQGSETTMVLTRGNACSMCRKRRRRCDAGKPACTPCVKAKTAAQCKYAGSDLGARKKSTALLQDLEESVDALESRIRLHSTSESHERESKESYPPAQTAIHAALPVYIPSRVAPRVIHRKERRSFTDERPIPGFLDTSTRRTAADSRTAAFLEFRWHFGIQWNMPRLLASLQLPATHPRAPHPSLLNAVLLHGAFFCRTGLKRYESLFYRRTSRELAISLEKGDRLFDFIRGSALISCYLYGMARLSEAHTRISGTLRFAVACGLHNISSPSLDTRFHMIPPCVDAIELGDRISTFWILFVCDRAGSLILGYPNTLADDEITTILPYRLSAYESGDYLHQLVDTIASMYDPHATLASARINHYGAVAAKSTALLNRAYALAVRVKGASVVSNALQQEIFRTAMASIKLADFLPPFYAQELEYESSIATRSVLAPVYIATHAAVIQILDILPDKNPSHRTRQAQAARDAMAIVKELQDAPFGYIPLLLGWSLTPVHAFLVREEMRYRKSGDKKNAIAVQDEIKMLTGTLSRVKELFPEPGVTQIDILEKNTSALRLIELV